MIRKILGWVDSAGNPTLEQLKFTYRELVERSGVSHDAIAEAIAEAVKKNLIRCVTQPARSFSGTQAISGVYELCWDNDSDYTNSPHEFRGFFYPEAMITADQDGEKPRARAARKNIPNAFFEEVIPNEKLSVIRVVGCLLFYSIVWGPAGERKQPVRKSITDLSYLTKMSRQHVHKAITEAIEAGYLERTSEGVFNPTNRFESLASEYGVRWSNEESKAALLPVSRIHLLIEKKSPDSTLVQTSEQPSTTGSKVGPIRKGVRRKQGVFGDLSEKVYEENKGFLGTYPKRCTRDLSEKVYEDLSEKVPTVSIKTVSIKTTTTAAADPLPAPSVPKPVAAAALCLAALKLKEVGFEETVAQQLAQKHSEADIQNQLAWLQKRKPSANRLGMLRRAIEQNWPEPKFESTDLASDYPSGVPFVQAYYAAYHGSKAQTPPMEKEAAAAEKFLQGLGGISETMTVHNLGARFGRLVRNEHQRSSGAKPYLRSALAVYGSKLAASVQSEVRESTREADKGSRKAKEAADEEEWLSYLRAEEKRLLEANREVYVEFITSWNSENDEKARLLRLSPKTIEMLKSEGSRIRALPEYLSKHSKQRVLDFESWRRTRVTCQTESGVGV